MHKPKPVGSSCSISPLLSLCRFCGNIWNGNTAIRCPVCSFGNIRIIPIPSNDHPKFTFKWLKSLKGSDFEYIEERLEAEIVVR